MPQTEQTAPTDRTLCRHCRARRVNRPRGLCWNCYYTPSIQAQYPSKNSFEHRGPRIRLCSRCGNPTGTAATKANEGRPTTCRTCRLPKPLRAEIHRRLARMEKLAEQRLPLFA